MPAILDDDEFEVAVILNSAAIVQEVETFCRNLGDLLGLQHGNSRWVHAREAQLEHSCTWRLCHWRRAVVIGGAAVRGKFLRQL
jgi:hypothetical protein